MKQSNARLIHVVLAVAIVLSVVNIFFITQRFTAVEKAQVIAKELMRPAALQAISLVNSACSDCYDISGVLTELKGMNVDVTSEKTISFDSAEGKKLLSDYEITKLPALVVNGEVNKTEQLYSFFASNGNVKDDKSAVYTNIPAPYYDISSNEVKGRVSVIHLEDSSCVDCKKMDQVDIGLKQSGVSIIKTTSYEYASQDAQQLITAYGITTVPAVLISKDVEYYPQIKAMLQQAGAKLKDDYYVLQSQFAPYRDLKQDKITGLVTLIMLTDDSCKECFDVKINRNILVRFGLVIKNEETYDIATQSAKALIDQYKIKKVPTILVSPEGKEYQSFEAVWNSVGSVESDGWFVMRNNELLGTYKDLAANKVVNPVPPQEQAADQGTAQEEA